MLVISFGIQGSQQIRTQAPKNKQTKLTLPLQIEWHILEILDF